MAEIVKKRGAKKAPIGLLAPNKTYTGAQPDPKMITPFTEGGPQPDMGGGSAAPVVPPAGLPVSTPTEPIEQPMGDIEPQTPSWATKPVGLPGAPETPSAAPSFSLPNVTKPVSEWWGGNVTEPTSKWWGGLERGTQSALSRAAMTAGLSMLSQGPSQYPVSFGESIGKAGIAGLGAFDEEKQRQLQAEQLKRKAEMEERGMAIEERKPVAIGKEGLAAWDPVQKKYVTSIEGRELPGKVVSKQNIDTGETRTFDLNDSDQVAELTKPGNRWTDVQKGKDLIVASKESPTGYASKNTITGKMTMGAPAPSYMMKVNLERDKSAKEMPPGYFYSNDGKGIWSIGPEGKKIYTNQAEAEEISKKHGGNKTEIKNYYGKQAPLRQAEQALVEDEHDPVTGEIVRQSEFGHLKDLRYALSGVDPKKVQTELGNYKNKFNEILDSAERDKKGNVDRLKVWNKFKQWADNQTSDPETSAFLSANMAIAEKIANIYAGGSSVTSDAKMRMAIDLLDPTKGPDAYAATLDAHANFFKKTRAVMEKEREQAMQQATATKKPGGLPQDKVGGAKAAAGQTIVKMGDGTTQIFDASGKRIQ